MCFQSASLSDTDGYTLVELIVALLVTLVLAGFLYSIYLATTRYVEPWRRAVMLEDQVHLIVHRLSADLAYAEQLIHEGNGTWTLTYAAGRAVQYSYQDSTLRRNSRRMHGLDAAAVAFHLAPSRYETRYALRRRDILRERERRPVQVQIHLALQSRERTLDVTTTTVLRQHRPWPPLP